MSTVQTNGARNSGSDGEGGTVGAEAKGYNGGYTGGADATRTLTPGGHPVISDMIVAASSHRRIANPVPTAAFAFATTTLTLSLYNCGVQGITVPNAVVAFAVFYGGTVQFLAGLWEFAAGNSLGATIFVSYGAFWWGLAMLFIPWFGELANYSSTQPGVYTSSGLGAAEAESAVGLYLWIWFGITMALTIPCIRASIALVILLSTLDITFVLLAAHYYTGSAKLQLAGGIFGCILAFEAYYVGCASLFTRQTSFFTLPTGPLGKH